MSIPGIARNEIVGVEADGLSVRIDDAFEPVPWQDILSINAVMALWERGSDRRLQVLVITVPAGPGERILMVGEIEQIWKPLVEALPSAFPETEPYVVWTEQLHRTGMVPIYERPSRVQ